MSILAPLTNNCVYSKNESNKMFTDEPTAITLLYISLLSCIKCNNVGYFHDIKLNIIKASVIPKKIKLDEYCKYIYNINKNK